MPTSYTSLLGLALPVTGELAGTWGDTVNNYITSYIDASVAGTQTISGSQTAVTLSVTNGSSLVTAGSGATGSAQFQIINCTGNPASLLTITAPASSRQYIIINSTSTNQSVKIVGTGPTTGITLVAGEKAHVAWNGSDFVKIATQNGSGDFVTVDTTNLEVTNIKAKDGTAAMSIADSTGVVSITANPVLSGGTANGVTYLNGSKVLTSGSALTFDGTNLGIGNTSPASYNSAADNLVIGLSGNNGMTIVSGSANAGYIMFADGTTGQQAYEGQITYDHSTNNMWFNVNGIEQARLTTSGLEIKQSQLIGYSSYAGIGSNGLAVNGSVGIGTASPAYKLDVNGRIRGNDVGLGSTSNWFYFDSFSGSNFMGLGGGTSLQTYVGGILVTTITSSGGLVVTPAAGGTAVFNEGGVDADFRVEGDTDANLLFVDASTDRVGIGTNTPSTKLQVAGEQLIQPTTAANAKLSMRHGSVAANNYFEVDSSSNTIFGANNAERARITSTGTVNIVGGGTPGSTQAVSFNGSAPVDSLVLNSSGNLGVGTASPGARLHSYSASGAGALILENGANTGVYARWKRPNREYYLALDINNNGGNDFSLYDATAAAMRWTVDSSGNLGLGVTPSAWNSSIKALDITAWGSVYGDAGYYGAAGIAKNAYWSQTSGTSWVYKNTQPALRYEMGGSAGTGTHAWYNAPSGTANTTTITNGVSYTIITSGNQTAFGAANNNVGTSFTATSSGTLSSGTVSQNISFTQAMTLDASGNLLVGATSRQANESMRIGTNGVQNSLLLGNSSQNNGAFVGAFNDAAILGVNRNPSTGVFVNTSNRASDIVLVGSSTDSYIAFETSAAANTIPTERARITSDGDLVVGGTSAVITGASRGNITINGTSTAIMALSVGGAAKGSFYHNGTDVELINYASGGDLAFYVNGGYRARITSGGDLLVGDTATGAYFDARANFYSPATYGAFSGKQGGAAGATVGVFWHTATTGDNVFALFVTEGSGSQAIRGSIDYNRAGGLVRYNTTSDYRAKDIIGPITNSGATIDALKVYEGVMKGATQSRPMLVAHEAQEHIPYAVSGVKDQVNEDGTPKYQQMDVSSLVPLLLAEIQSLRARVAALEAN